MRDGKALILAALVAALSTASLLAHHSFVSQFDLNNPITLRGKLTKVEWINPHGWIYMTGKAADDVTKDWKIETGSPVRMQARGLKKEDLQAGQEVIISGFMSKDGTATVAGWVINFPDREGFGREASFPLGR